MKKNVKTLINSIIVLTMLVSGCQKEKETIEDTQNTNQNPVTVDQLAGSWYYGSSEAMVLYLCNDGLFKIFQYNTVGEVQTEELGYWEYDNVNLTLHGDLSYYNQFKVERYEVINQSSSLWVNQMSTNVSMQFTSLTADPCLVIDPDGGDGGDGSGGGSGGDGTTNCPTTATDYDGNLYHVVKIGNQCWLKENLKTTHFKDGTPILPGTFTSDSYEMAWIYSTSGYYLPVQSPVGSLSDYLYNFATITDSRGICPEGFRLPTREDYEVLVEYLGGPLAASSAVKANSQWYSINVFMHDNPLIYNNGTNSSGFSAYPTGRISTSFIDKTNHEAIFWTSTGYSDDSRVGFSISAYVFEPFSLDVEVNTRNEIYINELAAIRCIAE